MNIIEYIGKEGVRSTGPSEFAIRRRLEKPHPGDVLIWDEGEEYPFHDSTRQGRFENFGTWADGEWHVCCNEGSVFLCENSVSISGGPFHSLSPDNLEPTYTLKTVRFWNWGDNGPGGGHGVEYFIPRPVFRYKSH